VPKMLEAWEFITQRPELLAEWTLRHLWIVFVANGIAVIFGMVLGLYITGKGREHTADTALYLAEITMTIPSLALFGLLMLLLDSMGLKAIGFLPAVIALIVYGQLPILRNTYTAVRQIEPAIIEAGKGVGMNERQLLLKVKLPLAVPVIMAGLIWRRFIEKRKERSRLLSALSSPRVQTAFPPWRGTTTSKLPSPLS